MGRSGVTYYFGHFYLNKNEIDKKLLGQLCRQHNHPTAYRYWQHRLLAPQNMCTFLPPAYVVRREGNSFTLLVCSHLGGWVPISHNALQHFPECHGADTWGVPCGGYPAGGVPCQGGTLPGGYPGRVSPRQGTPQPGQDGGEYPAGGYPVRTTEGVLTTRRAVCLLRSRMRTFLFM